jgi:2-keto-3-deoxy-L-rhamnonate aldolase RhmA
MASCELCEDGAGGMSTYNRAVSRQPGHSLIELRTMATGFRSTSNRIKRKLQAGEPVTGLRVFEFFRPAVAKVAAQAGFDMVVIEAEQDLAGPREVTDFIGCCCDNGMDVIVAPPSGDRSTIARYMDAGATGIKLPHAETAAQVNDVARWLKYPPEGRRGFVDGPNTQFRMPDVAKYCREANEATLLLVKIESRSGIENAEAIFETGCVDGVIFGPWDLSIDWRLPGQVDHPDLTSAMEKVAGAALSRGIAVAGHAADAETYRRERARGAQIFQHSSEIDIIRASAEAFMEIVRSL